MNPADPSHWRPGAAFETLRLRARLLAQARGYFAQTATLEVETPVMVQAGVTDVHLESLEVRRADGSRAGFLHTSPEYAMKRPLCAGAPDIYQVAHVFREGERGRLGEEAHVESDRLEVVAEHVGELLPRRDEEDLHLSHRAAYSVPRFVTS